MNQSAQKEFINFLLRRWQSLIGFAAAERVHIASVAFAIENDKPEPMNPILSVPYPCRQIEIIKYQIISVLPKVKFIDYSYEAQAPLDPSDFVELFVSDHLLCMSKVEKVLSGKEHQDGVKKH